MSEQIAEIFEFWKAEMNHSRARLDQKRRRKIQDRLKDGYTPDDIKDAIRGCKQSPFHQGQNENGTKYDDICLICRDAEHIDRFIALTEKVKFDWVNMVETRHAH